MNETSSLSARFRVVADLQGGGAFDVYVAVDDDKRLVVLKKPRREFSDNAEVSQAFRSEARLTARFQHPNIVEVQEIIEEADSPVLVMEFLDGATFHELVEASQDENRPLPLREHLEIIRQVCLGLHYCHELRDVEGEPLGLIHRDVSPHNIFITVANEIKILDFGIAKFDRSQGNTQAGLIKGKLRYMSPEQMSADKLDRKTDIYAVGVLLWDAITGRSLWSDVSDAFIVGRVLNGELPDPHPLVEDCPQSLLELARRCLATHANDRPESCEFIAEALAVEIESLPPSEITAGQLTRNLFEGRRARLRDQITAGTDTSPRQNDHSLIDRPPSGQVTRTTMQPGVTASEVPIVFKQPRRMQWLVGTVGIIGGVALLWFNPECSGGLLPAASPPSLNLAVDSDAPPSRALSSESVAVMVSPPEASKAAQPQGPIQIAVDVRPREGVEVRLDGEIIEAPFKIEALRDGLEHTVTATAPGHDPVTEAVVFDQDLKILLLLTPKADVAAPPPQAPPPTRSHRSSGRREPSNVPSPPSPPSDAEPSSPPPGKPKGQAVNCDPPFEVDERGYKVFKRECI